MKKCSETEGRATPRGWGVGTADLGTAQGDTHAYRPPGAIGTPIRYYIKYNYYVKERFSECNY